MRQGMLRFALEMLIFEAVGLGNPTERVLRCAAGDAPFRIRNAYTQSGRIRKSDRTVRSLRGRRRSVAD